MMLHSMIVVILGLFQVLRLNGYIVETTPKSWSDAQAYCQSQYGSNLATFYDAADYANLLSAIDAAGLSNEFNPIWIGLNDRNVEGTWKFVNGYNCGGDCDTLSQWNGNEPNNLGGEDCAEINGFGGILLNDLPCTNSHEFVCDDACGCSNSYLPVITPKTWNAAQAYCENEYGSNLATFYDATDYANLLTALNAAGLSTSANNPVWIGLNDRNDEGTWTFVNGYDCGGDCDGLSQWNNAEPNDLNGEDCAEIEGYGGTLLNDLPCAGNHEFVCDERCDCGYPLVTDICNLHVYYNDRIPRNKDEAEAKCNQEFGTSLATIPGNACDKLTQFLSSSNYASGWIQECDGGSCPSSCYSLGFPNAQQCTIASNDGLQTIDCNNKIDGIICNRP